jgi:hypothetical protein
MRLKRLLRPRALLTLLLCAPLLFEACGGGGQANSNDSAAANGPASRATANSSPAASQPTPSPQAQVVTATVEGAKLNAGGSGEAVVTLDIAAGYHVNANPASDKYYLPTELRAEPQEGLTPGKPLYPKSVTRKFQFSETPLSVYEGRAVIRLPLRADATASKGPHTLRATIRVQPCNDEVCLQPRNIDAPIPVTIN